ncbi:MAG: electron transfer flavoprotein subunit alpha/FixB family protein [Acidothermales bacterium]|nr:electron transfer flavoprotein subunit alpha/FixB family protein [Acidothermales bacterium]
MSEILVLVDHADGAVKKVTLELLTLARRLGEPAAVFVGQGYDNAKSILAEYGAAKVYVAADAELAEYVVAPKVAVLASLVQDRQPGGVLLPSSADGKEIAGRLAVRVGAGVITDAVDVRDGFVCEQSVFGGGTIVQSRVRSGVPIVTVRPNSAAPEAAPADAAEEQVSVTLSDADKAARITDRVEVEKGERPDLAEASIVVSGGRGVGSGENFAVIEALADALGAAVGASRAATDAGWYPHQYQVGQTGKTVSPQLYLAAGISGAIQHRAGMQTSKTIVVVNKDAEAPLFEIADFGVVGDLHQVVPQLTEEVKKRKA